MEFAFPATDAAGDAIGIHPVFWPKYASLHHLSVLWQSHLQLFFRGHKKWNELADGECQGLYDVVGAIVSLSVV